MKCTAKVKWVPLSSLILPFTNRENDFQHKYKNWNGEEETTSMISPLDKHFISSKMMKDKICCDGIWIQNIKKGQRWISLLSAVQWNPSFPVFTDIYTGFHQKHRVINLGMSARGLNQLWFYLTGSTYFIEPRRRGQCWPWQGLNSEHN